MENRDETNEVGMQEGRITKEEGRKSKEGGTIWIRGGGVGK